MLTIVDTGIANVGSIANMLRRIGAEPVIGSSVEAVLGASRLVLPGVGAYDSGMNALRTLGLAAPLTERVVEQGVPVLGICLGMQLLGTGSDEGAAPGLGWLALRSVRFPDATGTEAKRLRIPHMGWNTVIPAAGSALFSGMDADARFYFVHSYYVPVVPGTTVGTTEHGVRFGSAVSVRNIHGVQFHPEKSHRFGMQLLRNFLERC